MRFHRDGDLFVVTRVTGPTHNYLGIALDGEPGALIEVVPAPADGGALAGLDPAEVAALVRDGVDAANSSLGTAYHLRTVAFVPSDSGPVAIYRDLAVVLIERIHSGGAFPRVRGG